MVKSIDSARFEKLYTFIVVIDKLSI